MQRVVVGVDGSPESGAALTWAAADAARRGVALRVVYAEDVPAGHRLEAAGPSGPPGEGDEELRYWPQMCTRAACAQAADLLPGLEIESEVVEEETVRALVAEGADAGELVIGSRALDRISRFVLGSVGLPVIGHATAPVVAVREGAEQVAPGAPVVVAVDLHHTYDDVLGFAFEAARLREAPLRVLHAWSVRALYSYPSALPEPAVVDQAASGAQRSLEQAVRPRQERFPEVAVEVETATGAVAPYVLDSSADAGLLVVGRLLRERRLPVPVGPVTHAVLHHAPCPVAVVPHH
ncbi:universal stress protein [Streptomyces iconiensis]|uniref:Universal stress protein n=1 Tax=Streptomyces iconiensis TaxID=1384038 RepID=A0ABT6ZNW6_9ACTN|nr:universal stress protein [Streptomyces iconiensis]MDJ1130750.1 universal stress protein [Streptomyces iconiensis]